PSSTSLAVAPSATASPGRNAAPSGGEAITSVGGAFTTTVTCRLAVLPPLSVTAAVTVWVPERSVETRSVGPGPRAPSRLELHRIAASRLPSSVSLALAGKMTAAPGTEAKPAAGEVIARTGGVLKTTGRAALDGVPPRSGAGWAHGGTLC